MKLKVKNNNTPEIEIQPIKKPCTFKTVFVNKCDFCNKLHTPDTMIKEKIKYENKYSVIYAIFDPSQQSYYKYCDNCMDVCKNELYKWCVEQNIYYIDETILKTMELNQYEFTVRRSNGKLDNGWKFQPRTSVVKINHKINDYKLSLYKIIDGFEYTKPVILSNLIILNSDKKKLLIEKFMIMIIDSLKKYCNMDI